MSLASPTKATPPRKLDRLARLRDRAAMLAASREFFRKRNVCEVDCPCLSRSASVDTHIDLLPAIYAGKERRYLHSSPEFGMKRLLCEGMGDIYQLSHVFRDSEWSRRHNPEFMLIEWYRVGMSFENLIAETLDFARLFLGPLPATTITYRQALREHTGIDYVKATPSELCDFLRKKGIETHLNQQSSPDDLLNLILGIFVEPRLGKERLCALTAYPASQAALAQTHRQRDEDIAERFEIYYKGVELANGYHELGDPVEQRQRFADENRARMTLGKDSLPPDENLLHSLQQGLPDCCGVAVGFDRLLMLRQGVDDIRHVLPFGWENA